MISSTVKSNIIRSTRVSVVATSPTPVGCLPQIINGCFKREGLPLRVVHPITLLAEAYRQSP